MRSDASRQRAAARNASGSGVSRERRRGITLVELMIALAIGAFLILGAVTVFGEARAAYRSQVLIARLHENARFALAAIGPDVRMAGYLGLTASPNRIAGRAGPTDPPSLMPFASDCAPNWAVDLDRPLEAWNNRWAWQCRARADWVDGSDTFVVRRAEVEAASLPLERGRIYVQSDRIGPGRLFVGPSLPAGPPASATAVRPLVVSGYYVSTSSVLDEPGQAVPSLRRKALQGLGVVDEEVMPGVEDMQVQLGVDTDPPGSPGHGAVDRFVDPESAVLRPAAGSGASVEVVALRIWLRLRSEAIDKGFSDSRVYRYADAEFRPTGAERGYRRVVVSRTIYLRNARRSN